jgi:hypothetical protein
MTTKLCSPLNMQFVKQVDLPNYMIKYIHNNTISLVLTGRLSCNSMQCTQFKIVIDRYNDVNQ